MAQSLFKVLKTRYHDAQIDLLAPEWSKALADRMPEVNSVISAPTGHGELSLNKRFRLGRSLASRRYDWAIVLPNSLKSALIPYFASIPRRTGFVGEFRYGLLNDAHKLDKKVLRMTVQRFVALGLERGEFPSSPPKPRLLVNERAVADTCRELGLAQDKPVLALCPGAEYGPAKRWPERHYAETAQYFLQQGWQVWLFGSEKDKTVTQSINQLAEGACIDLAGKTSLPQVIDLISLAEMVVSNDSGLMHIAAALDKNLVAIYGSSDPEFTPPLSDKARIVSLDLDCSPCFKRECPLGHLNCLNNIAPQTVIHEIESRNPGMKNE